MSKSDQDMNGSLDINLCSLSKHRFIPSLCVLKQVALLNCACLIYYLSFFRGSKQAFIPILDTDLPVKIFSQIYLQKAIRSTSV